MVLFPHLPFDPSETHLSFAARLAAFHRGGRLVPFLNDLGIKAAELAGGQRHAVLALCHHADVDPPQVIANTPISTGKARYALRDEEISADFLSNPSIVFCPACILDDDQTREDPALARRGRFEWPLRAVRTCPVHGTALIERAHRAWGDQFHELAIRVPERGDALQALAAGALRRPASPLQEYVLSRLAGAAGPEWLDSQSLEQAVRATEMLGVLVEFGTSRKVGELNSDDWDRAGRAGYAFTSRGETGIREGLDQVQVAFRKTGRRPRHRNVFGRLFDWLASAKLAKDPGDIRRIVREHMFDTVEMARGAVLLGERLPERRLHSVASLARESGHHPKTLRHLLIARGLISRHEKHAVFDAAAGREVAASARNLVHIISVPKALNCSRPQAAGLLDERILMPIAVGEAGTPGYTQKAVDAENIDGFLSALAHSACTVDAIPLGMVPISKAAEKAKMPGVDILHLVLGGYLSSVAMISTVRGYAAVHVDPAEVREKADEYLFGLSPSMAAAQLHLPTRTIWSLMADRESEAFLPSAVLHGPNGRHSFHRILPDAVERFQNTYAPAAQIASASCIDRKVLERELRSARIQPAISSAEVGVDLYLIDELPPPCSATTARAA